MSENVIHCGVTNYRLCRYTLQQPKGAAYLLKSFASNVFLMVYCGLARTKFAEVISDPIVKR